MAYSMVAVPPPCIEPHGHHIVGVPENTELHGIGLGQESRVDS